MKIVAFFGILLAFVSLVYGQISIKVEPEGIDHFVVEAPEVAIAGEEFTIRLYPKDALGNFTTKGLENLTLSYENLEVVSSRLSPSDFAKGYGEVVLMPIKTGSYSVAFLLKGSLVKLRHGERYLYTLRGQVYNGPPVIARVKTPESFLPGYPVTIEAWLYDAMSNPVIVPTKPYSIVAEYEGLRQTIPITAFEEGRGKFELTLDYTKPVRVDLIEANTRKKLASFTLTPKLPKRVSFRVGTQEANIVANKPFRLTIEALDEEGRLVKVYDRIGSPVYLRHSGTGKLYPSVIEPTQFVEGVANILVVYNKGEVINIYADEISHVKDIPRRDEKTEVYKKPFEIPPVKEIPKEDRKAELQEKITTPPSTAKQKTREQKVQKTDKCVRTRKQASQKTHNVVKQQKTKKETISAYVNIVIPSEVGKIDRVSILEDGEERTVILAYLKDKSKEHEIPYQSGLIKRDNTVLANFSLREDKDGNLIILVDKAQKGITVKAEVIDNTIRITASEQTLKP